MSEIRETAIDHMAGDDYATICSSEKKWINYIQKLKAKNPSDVEIKCVNSDGSIMAKFPVAWITIKPKKKVNMTPAQIEASKARLEAGRLKRLKMIGDGSVYVKRKDTFLNERREEDL